MRYDISRWEHDHVFDRGNAAGERGTRAVAWLTAVMMVVEIVAGWWYNSMALLADGFHMSSHALAIGLSAFAYAAARRYATDQRFAFGTWKIEILGGFASAVLLLAIVALMVFGSVERLIAPQPIHYQEAIIVAIVGLAVNVLSALILGRAHHDDHHQHHGGRPQPPSRLESQVGLCPRHRRRGYLRARHFCAVGWLALWVVVARPDDGAGGGRAGCRLGQAASCRYREGTSRPRNGPPCRRRNSRGCRVEVGVRADTNLRSARLAGRSCQLLMRAQPSH